MSARRHEQQTRTSDSGHGVLDVWGPLCGAVGFETYGGGIRTRLEGILAVFGEIRGGGPVWDVESGGTVCVLVADCQWPQSRARLKPET